MAEFTDQDLSIIRNMMISKSNKTIAALLDCKTQDIDSVIARIKQTEGLPSFQDKIDAKRKPKPQKVKAPKKIRQETDIQRLAREKKEERAALKVQRLNMDEKSRVAREIARGPKFKTKETDYKKLRTLRIDRKTFIYINPGQDEEKAKADFLKTYKKSFQTPENL